MGKDNRNLQWFKKLSKKERSRKEHRLAHKQNFMPKKEGIDVSTPKMAKLMKYTTEANQWVDEVAVLMKVDDRKDLAWKALRGVLHAVRDRLIPEEVFQLSAQLPMLIRGLFFEGYHYSGKPDKFDVDEFKNRINVEFGSAMNIRPELVFKSVLYVLYDHISDGELQDIYENMPRDIQQLWDKSLKPHTEK